MPSNPIRVNNNVEWVNHHFNIKVPIAKRLRVHNENPTRATMSGMRATAARLQGIIADALAAGVQIRACGSRWSFSDIPVVKNGWVIETANLDWTFKVGVNDVDLASGTSADELYLVQCGTNISKINERLETKTRRRALRTSGASNGQTIAGAIGTGVHGSAIDVGGMESQVAGIQVLTATQNLWIEPARAPVMTANFAAKLGATLVRDDAKFDAAIVSLGALGIVHAVMLRSTGRYLLNSSLLHIPYGQLQTALNTLDFRGSGLPDQTRRPYFFQVILDPAKMDIGEGDLQYALDHDTVKAARHDIYSMVPPDLIGDIRRRSMQRVSANKEFQDLLRRISSYVEQKEQNKVSLEEESFFARREELNAQKEEEDEQLDAQLSGEEIYRDNFYNQEVINIAGDYIEGLKKQNLANAG